jgi:hypothetical protein
MYRAMYRQITILTLLFVLFITACTSTTVPAAPTQPATPATEIEAEAEEEITAAPEEAEITTTESVTTETVITEPVPTETETTEAETAAATGCLEPTGDEQLISSPVAGYCFLIPANFERSEYSDVEGFNLGIYGPESTPGHRERGFVNVTEVTTDTLEGSVQIVVDEVIAAMPGFTPTQSSLTWGGVPAIRIDNLPGQDANRKIYVIYENRLYELTFVPADPGRPDAYAEMEELYTLMLDSFRFMPATDMASSYAPHLTWEGEIDGACHNLVIQPSGEASVTLCGDAPTVTTTLNTENGEWAAIQQHFGNINAETPAGKIVFQGQGSAEGDLWSQALATWASFTVMELNAGRTSASARTVLAWKVTDSAEHSGQCSHLVVLAYGYAYANLIPCEDNGPSTQVAAGWLTDAELDTLYQWLEMGARVEDEAGYLDAKGSEAIAPEEVGTWAKAVYARMIQ